MSTLILIIAPHELDRHRLLQAAVERHREQRGWLVRWLDQIPQPDLFASPEIWVWKDPESLPNPELLLNSSTGVVITSAAKLPEHRLWRSGEVVDLSLEKPWEREGRLARTLSEWAHRYGKVLPTDVALSFVRRLGCDHPALDQELDKVCQYVGQRHHIQESDLLAITEASQQETGWLLGEAILTKDLGRAMQLAETMLLVHDQPLPSLLGQLRLQLEQALASIQLSREHLSKTYPYLKGKKLELVQQGARKLGARCLELMLLRLLRVEEQSRQQGGTQDHYWKLQSLLGELHLLQLGKTLSIR